MESGTRRSLRHSHGATSSLRLRKQKSECSESAQKQSLNARVSRNKKLTGSKVPQKLSSPTLSPGKVKKKQSNSSRRTRKSDRPFNKDMENQAMNSTSDGDSSQEEDDISKEAVHSMKSAAIHSEELEKHKAQVDESTISPKKTKSKKMEASESTLPSEIVTEVVTELPEKTSPTKPVKKFDGNKASASDSDSAPEEITFSLGRDKAVHLMESATRQALEIKKQIRKQRSNIHQRNLLQKEAKRQKTDSSKMLSEDILKLVANLPRTEEIAVAKPNKKTTFDEAEVSGSNAEVNRNTMEENDEFISLSGPTKFKVKVLDEEVKKPYSISDEVFSFRQKMLYGERVRRESTKSSMAYRSKQLASGKLHHTESFNVR